MDCQVQAIGKAIRPLFQIWSHTSIFHVKRDKLQLHILNKKYLAPFTLEHNFQPVVTSIALIMMMIMMMMIGTSRS